MSEPAVIETRIRGLPIWRGAVDIEPLTGGITNLNFRVRDDQRTCAVRSGEDDTLLGISREAELRCARLAADLGVAPAVVYAQRPFLVTEFVAGEPLTPELLRDHGRLARVARALRIVHGAREITGHLPHFSPFLVARTYLAIAAEHGFPTGDIDAADLQTRIAALEARIAPFVPAFCHNDLMPGNLLDDGHRLWLIDWEYAGIGHPLFDLAGLASNAELDAVDEHVLLSAWLGCEPDAALGEQLAIMRAMAALREALWAVVQATRSTIDFDYRAYRDENYGKFERALD